MWFNPETVVRMQSPKETEEMKLQREAEKKMEEVGQATCAKCGDEIWKNDRYIGAWVWESEELVGYCAKGGLHRPLVTWKPEEGIVNL